MFLSARTSFATTQIAPKGTSFAATFSSLVEKKQDAICVLAHSLLSNTMLKNAPDLNALYHTAGIYNQYYYYNYSSMHYSFSQINQFSIVNSYSTFLFSSESIKTIEKSAKERRRSAGDQGLDGTKSG